MKEEDFVFTVGYQGDTAIIEGKAQRKFKSASVEKLLEEGMYKAAFCRAVYADDKERMRQVLNVYNEKSGSSYDSVDKLKRLFGVFSVPGDVVKIKVV